MTESQNHHENAKEEHELPEYDYNAGFQETLKRIQEGFEQGSQIMVLGINGSGTQVGKTTFRLQLERELRLQSTPASKVHIWPCHDFPKIDIPHRKITDQIASQDRLVLLFYNEEKKFFPPKKIASYRSAQEQVFRQTNPSFQTRVPHLWIAIQSQSKPFPKDQVPLGDLLITNEYAP